jgi:hypothetical protein
MLGLGQQPSPAVIIDRLVATGVGCALVLALDQLIWAKRITLPRETNNARSRSHLDETAMPKYSCTVSHATVCKCLAVPSSRPAVYLRPTGDFLNSAA